MKYDCGFPNSTMLQSASYDDENQELTVVFANGRSYTYIEVAINTYMELRDAPSAGRYLNSVKANLKGKP